MKMILEIVKEVKTELGHPYYIEYISAMRFIG